MPLSMPRPMKRTGSSLHQFVQRIPADVKSKVRGTQLSIPVGDVIVPVTISEKAQDVRVSLRTRDPQEARARQAAVVAYLEGVWRAVREGPRRLTHKQILALAGEVYRTFIAACEDDPGSPELWASVTHANVKALHGEFGRASLLIASDDERRAKSLAERFGPIADTVLAKHGLVVDADSRARLIEQVGLALREAGEGLFFNALGDYGPDTRTERFPSWKPEAVPKVTPGGISLRSLFDRWKAETAPAASTASEWQRAVDGFIAYIRHDEATRITKAEVAGWKAELLSKGLSAKTINDTKLAALRRVLAWGVDNGLLSENPAQGVTIRRKPKPGEEMDGFSDAQAAAILTAAAASQRPPIRWVPLLCAGTGARVGEMCQLRGEDVQEVDGIAVLRITAEAGSVKNAPSERTIPLPPSAIEAGFLDFARGRKGPLFYDPSRRNPEAKRPPYKIVANRIADWVRSLNIKGVGREARVDPNHGWRHRFHTKARAAEVSDQVADRITGRGAAKGSGAKYGRAELETMLRAMSKIPVPNGAYLHKADGGPSGLMGARRSSQSSPSSPIP